MVSNQDQTSYLENVVRVYFILVNAVSIVSLCPLVSCLILALV